MCDTAQTAQAAPVGDEGLLRRSAGGDHAAFAQLVRRHQHRVIQLATRLLSSPHKAEDIAQEAFLRVYRSAGRFEPKAKFTTWLYRIVVNLCNDEHSRLKFKSEEFDNEPVAHESQDEVQLAELKAAVHRAVDRLPARQKEALVLHRFEGLSQREIASVLEVSESAAESLLVRAYANLRESLNTMDMR